jgi:hypothetical protein
VTDDWPAEVPITEAEIEVFEAWFGDLFDELFSMRVFCVVVLHPLVDPQQRCARVRDRVYP